jgi:hypothetical protein
MERFLRILAWKKPFYFGEIGMAFFCREGGSVPDGKRFVIH